MYKALKEAEEEGNEFNYMSEPMPRCPHCGEEFSIENNEAWHLYGEDGDENVVECDHCGEKFTVTTDISYSFSTDEQPNEEEPEE
jgi:uncharacterized Zn-finger protein